MKVLGKTTWAIPGGHIPLHSTGHEPEFTSRDELCLLNTSDQEANIEITIFYVDREPVGPYRLKVQARRVRHIRFNDLINPEAILLDTDYASVIESDVPIVVQFSRLDSSRAENSSLITMAFPGS
ncbi:sensory rhodopsin transducer [Chlorogloeopsis sp. ULAP01]|uniref:sensory rhodopsin transducer n=1 Tax=Chlorogloeopsis sp. ULAP01 TaxID=3056483 RepID=UPI0025AAA6DF|nr:sensory rhodopsin transducer [Chlorogloeopsis sp. ULAP01]MDM9379756.1 sensory rhodopsin transducer [Chlorogloeopsis sp. ULAP01]